MSSYADPLTRENPYIAQTRIGNIDARLQRLRKTSTFQTAAKDMAARATAAGALPGAIPSLPGSAADMVSFDRRMSGLPGYVKTALNGPSTIQNTGLTGVNASTPGGTARTVATTRSTPLERTAAMKQPVVNPPQINTPIPTTVDANGVRTVQIDQKYQTPADQIGKGEVVGKGGAAPSSTVGVSDPNQWKRDLFSKYPDIFKSGTAANQMFVDAYKQHNDPTRAMETADQVMSQKSGDDAALAQHNTDKALVAGDAAVLADHNAQKPGVAVADAIGAASALPAQPRVTVNGANNPPVAATPAGNPNLSPALNRGLQDIGGIASNVAAGLPIIGGAVRDAIGNTANSILNPIGTTANRVLDAAGTVGSAVAPLVLSPQGQKSASSTWNNLSGTVGDAASAGDAALRAPAYSMGLPVGVGAPADTGNTTSPPVESDDDRKARLAMVGLPGY